MSDTSSQDTIDFSLAGGGLLGRFLQRFMLTEHLFIAIIVFTIITWLPLLIASIAKGLAVGEAVKIPFLQDYGVYGRLLVAFPVLLLAEIPIGIRSREVLREFITSRFIRDQDIPLYNLAICDAARRKESVWPDIIIIGIIYAGAGLRGYHVLSDPLNTWYRLDGSITAAGWYYVLVSLPVFQYLMMRWIWKLAIWTGLLWRISRMDLQLLPIHPDKMGGLGFLGLAQIPFSMVGFAGSAITSSYLANSMVYQGVSLSESSRTMVGYVILAILFVLAPILVFTDKLIKLRAKGILKYGDIGEEYVRLFDDKWAKGINPEHESILGSSDIQSLADLRNSFDIVQNMSLVAVDRKTITAIVIASAIPMIPIFFLALPFEEIIARVFGIFG